MRTKAREQLILPREHNRYKMRSGILAALSAPGTLELTIGHIVDISEAGLAIVHVKEITAKSKRAEIILIGHENATVFNFKIPAKLIYKNSVEDGFRSGFEFSNLSNDQKTRLLFFIQSNMEPAAA